MSEPVKHDGIEDVLSSIRRLVSEDTRGVAVPPAAPPRKPAEALVLTPALRVAEPDFPAGEGNQVVEAEAAGGDELPGKLQFVRASASRPAQKAADPAPQDPAPWAKPDSTLFEAAGGVSEEAVSSSSLKEKIAALEAVIGGTEDQWEPDGESSDEYAGTNVEPLTWEDHTAEPAPAPQDAGAEALEAEYLAEEAVTEAALDSLSPDEAVLDEASLRELVADIVREELQGALGERITRNVRKLVRREIHRAMAAQELG